MRQLAKPVVRKTFTARAKRLSRLRHPATLAANATKDVFQILCEGRVFQLRRPIDLSVRRKGPYYFVGYPALGIEGYGRGEQQALESFSDVFSTTWDWIAMTRDSQLGTEARELKRQLSELVAEVHSAS